MRLVRLGATLLLGLVVACGSDNTTGPGTNLPNGTFSMQVNGSSFQAISATVLITGNIIAIGAGTAANEAMGMAWVDAGPRTYTVNTDVGTNGNYNAAGSGAWTASTGTGSGSITVTTRAANRVAGTFSFVMQPVSGTAASGTRTVTGSFDLTF